MSTLGWRLVSVLGAFLVAFLAPLVLLIVVNGIVRTGMVGTLSLVAWGVAMVFLARAVARRRRTP